MIKNLLKSLYRTRLGVAVLFFIVGGLCSYFIMPSKTIIKTVTTIEYKDKIVYKYLTKWKTKIVEVEKQVSKTKHTIKWPDGKEESWEVFESNSQQISRIDEQYKTLMVDMEKQWKQKYEYLKESINIKYLTVYGGPSTSIKDTKHNAYVFGFNYNFWSIFTLGAQVDTHSNLAGTIGIRF